MSLDVSESVKRSLSTSHGPENVEQALDVINGLLSEISLPELKNLLIEEKNKTSNSGEWKRYDLVALQLLLVNILIANNQ